MMGFGLQREGPVKGVIEGDASKQGAMVMKAATVVLVVWAYGGLAAAQDLPPAILADMYLLEATEALEKGDGQAAIRAFGKIEDLDTEQPLEFLYLYGKLLVESSSEFDDVLKGQSLLKQYVLNIEKTSEDYRPTLTLLSMAGAKLEEIQIGRRALANQRAEARRQAEARWEAEPEVRRQMEWQLWQSITDVNLEEVKSLLALGINPNAKFDLGWTPLHGVLFSNLKAWNPDGSAIAYSPSKITTAVKIAKILISAGADVNARDNSDSTPLHFCAGEAEAHSALSLQICRIILSAGADINARDNVGTTSLHLAASTGQSARFVQKIRDFLSAGANVNVRDGFGYTPLHRAVENTVYLAYEKVKVLIAAGADVNAGNSSGKTPLHTAVRRSTFARLSQDSVDVVGALLAAGADVSAEDKEGTTVLEYVEEMFRNQEEVPKKLVDILRAAAAPR